MPSQDLAKAFDPNKQDISTVISLLPTRIDETKPGLIPPQYIIPAVKDPMKDISILHVVRANFPVYLDENRPALIVPAPSDTVAASICRDYKISMSEYTPGIAEPGLFWARGQYDEKTVRAALSEEYQYALNLQIEWFKKLVEVADDDWGRYHSRKMIATIQKQACAALKLEREWNIEREITANLALKPCPFCRADIHPEAIICTHCRGIVNMARYKAEYVEAGMAPK